MFNAVLRALLESYLLLAIQMWTSWLVIKIDGSFEARLNATSGLALTAFCFVFPFSTYCFIFRRRDQIGEKEFEQRYGSLTQNISYYKIQSLAFTLFFLLRRLLLAYTIVNLGNYGLVYQVLAIDVLSTSLLCYYVAA